MAMLASAAVQAGPKDEFRFEHLFQIDRVVDAQIAPDGSMVAVVTERRKPDAYFSSQQTLWLVPREGGTPKRLRTDDANASLDKPIWSPDGRRLLYRISHEKAKELAILDLQGRQARTMQPCKEEETAGTAAWSPDGRRIAVICNGESPRGAKATEAEKNETRIGGDAEDGQAEGGKALESKVIVATRSRFYDDSMARPWSPERRIVLIGLDGKDRIEVMRDRLLLDEPGALQWHEPDTLWMIGTPTHQFGGMSFANGRVLHSYDLHTRQQKTLATKPATQRMPILTGSGASFLIPVEGTVALLDLEQFRHTWELQPLKLVRMADGILDPTPLATLNIYVGLTPFVWTPTSNDGSLEGTLYFQWFDRGSNRIKAFHPARNGDGRWQDLTPADTNVTTFNISADGSTMALVQGDANTPNDVYLLDLRQPGAAPQRLTRFGDKVRELYSVSQVEAVRWRSADDRFDIDGWLVKPADYQRGNRYPLILDVHGGPGSAFRNSFDDLHFEGAHQVPPELYLSRGYLVLMANPRGDPGYGSEYQEAILEGWEYPTRYDLIEGVKEMVRRGYADPGRLGIAGASYGGWVTAFAVTQTDIFKAASANDPVVDTGVSSAVAYRGNLLSNYWLHAGFADGHLLDVPFPKSDPHQVKTPILLRFGLKEEPPMPSQFFVSGLQYFTYLHAHCRPVEMIMHPDEGHGVLDGETWRDYVERDLAWFDYWLLGKGELPYKPHECHP